MAVGATERELHTKRSRTAARTTSENNPLPEAGMGVTLAYPGKLSESEILRTVDEAFSELSNDGRFASARLAPNAVVLADNWFALHALRNANTKADLIYLDPPYATGADFQSRALEHAYQDNMADAAYVEFMRRRLILMRELLSDQGSIFVHIGHQMVAHMKLLLDEIFGPKNFRNLIVRRKCSSKNFTKSQFSNLNDYLLFYSKTARYTWNRPTVNPGAEWIEREYPKADKRGHYKLVPVHAPGTRNGETGKPWRGVPPPPGKHWQYQPSKLDELDSAGEIHWSRNGNPRRKVYLANHQGVGLTDYWEQFRDAHHQSILVTGYPTEKNLDMMKMIVGACSNPGDLVVDPFCGSGTTLHAAEELERSWIGIDQSMAAVRATLGRLNGELRPMGDFVAKPEGAATADLFELNTGTKLPFWRATSSFRFFVDEAIRSTFPKEVSQLGRSS